jgi:indole-3-glycerol phosphate synthase
MHDFLRTMANESKNRARNAKRHTGEGELMRRASLRPPPPPLRLSREGFDVIAEIKPASPSAGRLANDDLFARAGAYVRGGAAAVSVLTEPSAFRGSLALLREMAIAVVSPVMRKDFLVEPYQVAEARDEGASGVLLITQLLGGSTLDEMLDVCSTLGLFALIEAFERDELERAQAAAASARGEVLLGVNARNLATLRVNTRRFDELAPSTSSLPMVAESGIDTPAGAARVASLGFRAVLVGESLMRTADPEADVAAMLQAGRSAPRPTQAAR